MEKGILVINAGSTSVKFSAYSCSAAKSLDLVCGGQVEGIGSQPSFVAKDSKGKPIDAHDWEDAHPLDQEGAVKFIVAWLETHQRDLEIAAVGHRVVQGGPAYPGPVLVDETVISELEKLEEIEPSHQPFEVDAIRAFAKANPKLPQVAAFDTAFHRTMPAVAQRYALPAAVAGNLIRRWGFHGISYRYISRALPRYAPTARRAIVAHLGGGASMCAMLDGKSMDTSMGLGALDGLPMATRCGAIDPEILLFLLKERKYTAIDLETLLYKKSGLLGLSGVSEDMRKLKDSKAASAAEAIDYFVYQIVKFAGAYTAVLGGLDAFVFTAGIGENDPPLRAAVVEKLAWLGAKLDVDANNRNGPRISTEDSKVSFWVIPTNEELMIAQHTAALVDMRS
jgi:acetate kinase